MTKRPKALTLAFILCALGFIMVVLEGVLVPLTPDGTGVDFGLIFLYLAGLGLGISGLVVGLVAIFVRSGR
ncbi:hypothetical protein [Frigoribacterium sp. Leaf172]|uniref:hypothetical protein n=1 Tax=Frigoribacterium sp. Leaf172 TaxID=1736285 RepID=UPI0006F1DAE4|nr:hypothetical protein [Frigoribacterium sp. Leaf172]KQR65988.1 hypothetical protein ASF89_02160 [Frigoribacterium sp. Leaf172]